MRRGKGDNKGLENFLEPENKEKKPLLGEKLLACVVGKHSRYKRLYLVETSGNCAQRTDVFHSLTQGA